VSRKCQQRWFWWWRRRRRMDRSRRTLGSGGTVGGVVPVKSAIVAAVNSVTGEERRSHDLIEE